MNSKDVSLNLVLKKRGSLDALKSVPEPSLRSIPQDTAEAVGRTTIYRELADAAPPPAVLEAFPDWVGLLIKSAVLDMAVWVVRSRQDGAELARETGHPALLLDDVLDQKGRNPEEARAALLPMLIAPGGVQ